jgi:hypothetical protein
MCVCYANAGIDWDFYDKREVLPIRALTLNKQRCQCYRDETNLKPWKSWLLAFVGLHCTVVRATLSKAAYSIPGISYPL